MLEKVKQVLAVTIGIALFLLVLPMIIVLMVLELIVTIFPFNMVETILNTMGEGLYKLSDIADIFASKQDDNHGS